MRWLAVLVCLILPMGGWAEETKLSAELEQRVKGLAHELRCLVCQNQTIADSNADLAIDLRTQIREQIQAGKTDQQIKDYMVARYGDFVLYRPPVQSNTVLLWVAPFLLLVGGIGFLFWRLAKRRKLVATQQLSTDELQQADTLLKNSASSDAPNTKS
ncbi:MAG: cytochrome c-type biogenesis protein CcmH [Pseudomonadota bacterium]|nr:cytochrome c-type biogenesis protein CcmH [Pseudomonadota bacterium]